jgi:hypothetical protein
MALDGAEVWMTIHLRMGMTTRVPGMGRTCEAPEPKWKVIDNEKNIPQGIVSMLAWAGECMASRSVEPFVIC